MYMPVFMLTLSAMVFLLSCGGSRGNSECASKLNYVTNQFTSGENAVRHASEYRVALSVGSDDIAVSAIIDTASANLVINENNFYFGTKTSTGKAPFVYVNGDHQATAINAKDTLDIGCISDLTTRFALTAKDSATDNILGLSFGDPAHRPHEKKSPAFFDQLVKDEGIYNIFSLALCRSFGNSHILLGGIDGNMRPWIGNYIPIIEKTAYVVPAISLRFASTKKVIADFPLYNAKERTGVRTILDSASSFLLLPVEMASTLSNEIEHSARSLDIHKQFPEGFFRTERSNSTKVARFLNLAQIRQFPALEISFRGVDKSIKSLEISPLHYFKEIDADDPLVRTFAVRETSGDVVLGQPFLESHYAVFDRKNARIGFGNIDLACAPY